MACTQPCSCCKGACCYDDGGMVCAQHTCEDCEALPSGTWKGAGTNCADYDCTDGCCEDLDCVDSSGEFSYTNCLPGYSSACPGSSCTVGAKRSEEHPDCEFGSALPSTITGSGFVSLAGDPTLDPLIDECFNNSYAINRDCCEGGEFNGSACSNTVFFDLSDSDYQARVVFPTAASGRVATIQLWRVSTASVITTATRSDGGYSASAAPCGSNVFACGESVSGIPTSGHFLLDTSAADITAS